MGLRRIILGAGVLLVMLGIALLTGALGRPGALPPMPDATQTYERHEVAPRLRVQVTRALAVYGLTLSDLRAITVDPAECPATCNSGMEHGLCLCSRDARGVCPAGFPLERNKRRSPCASLPATIGLHGDAIPGHLQAVRLPFPRN